MFFAAAALSAAALAAVADAASCNVTSVEGVLTTSNATTCSSDSGYSVSLLASPTASEMASMCTSTACQWMLADLQETAPSECTLGTFQLYADLITLEADYCEASATNSSSGSSSSKSASNSHATGSASSPPASSSSSGTADSTTASGGGSSTSGASSSTTTTSSSSVGGEALRLLHRAIRRQSRPPRTRAAVREQAALQLNRKVLCQVLATLLPAD